jgi:hypothetical protein
MPEMNTDSQLTTHPVASNQNESMCQSIEWFCEGQSRIVDVGGIQVAIRLVARKGRRSRIAIKAPAGAVFRAAEGDDFDSVE